MIPKFLREEVTPNDWDFIKKHCSGENETLLKDDTKWSSMSGVEIIDRIDKGLEKQQHKENPEVINRLQAIRDALAERCKIPGTNRLPPLMK